MTAYRFSSYAIAAMLLAMPLGACVSPSATQSTQSKALKKGDSFTLLTPAPVGHPMAAMDEIVLREAAARTGALSGGTHWLLEYSYAIRPAAIAMKSDAAEHGYAMPPADAMLECNKTSHRVTVRVIADEDGAQSYRGTAEKMDCRSELQPDQVIFSELLGLALNSLHVE